MSTAKLRPAIPTLPVVHCLSALAFAQAQQTRPNSEQTRWVIEAIGTETVQPDVIHLMMKMEYESGLAADATRAGEERLHEFLAAVGQLQISGLTYRVSNTLITPAQARRGVTTGFVYTRNVVLTLLRPSSEESEKELDRVIAKLEDLGARYNSHCVTCIGSG